MEDLARVLHAAVGADNRAINAVPAVQGGYNGILGDVDLSKPRDFVGEEGKIVVANNQYSLSGNLAYQLWLSQGKPGAPTAVTEAHALEFTGRAIRVIARFRIYSVLYASGLNMTTRAADHVTAPNIGADGTNYIRRFVEFVTQNEESRAALSNASVMIMHSMFSNAIHREQNNDHSWFTREGDMPKTQTGRCIAVAGPHRDAFQIYMRRFGHDGNHHLDTASLRAACDCMAGIGAHPITMVNARYMGEVVTGREVKDILIVDEAATDRWPASLLGKAALIIGLQMLDAVMTDIATKVKLHNTGHIRVMSTRLGESLRAHAGSRAAFKQLEQALGPVIALVYGYCVKSNIVEEEQYKAFQSHANRLPSHVANGKSLATAIAVAIPHAEAVSGAVEGMCNAVAQSLRTASNVAIPGTAGPDPYAEPARFPGDPVKAEVGEDQGSKMIDILRGRRGDTFFDANA